MVEALQTVATALLSILTSGVLMWLAVNWLAKLWLNKFIEKDKHKYTQELEGLKKNYEKELSLLQANLEKSNHVSITQYDKEFSIYQEIWKALIDHKKYVDYLFLKLETTPKEKDEYYKFLINKYDNYSNSYNEFSLSVLKNAPFYEKKIKDKLEEMLDICFKQGKNYENYYVNPIINSSFKGMEIGITDEKLWETAFNENPNRINQITKEIEEEIREHLNSLTF